MRRRDARVRSSSSAVPSCTRPAGLRPRPGPRTPDPLRIGSKLELAAGGTLYLDAVHELPTECHESLAEMHRAATRRAARDAHRRPGHRLHHARAPTRDAPAPSRSSRLFSRRWLTVPALARSARRHAGYRAALRATGTHAGWARSSSGISPESMQRLQAYPWPGNVRELRTVIERAVLVSKSSAARDRRGAAGRRAGGRQLPAGLSARVGRHGRGLAGHAIGCSRVPRR